MLDIPVLRWGQPYESLDKDEVVHFTTGETLATVSQGIPGLLAKDIRKAQRARRGAFVNDHIHGCRTGEQVKKTLERFKRPGNLSG